MQETTNKNPLFKPYLKPSNLYVGGKSRNEVAGNGKKIYKLSSNENPLGPSPKAVAAIRKAVDNISEYPDRTDIRLRKALQTYYQDALPAEQFITGNSGCEVLEMIIRAFLDKGTEFIVSNPMFSPYRMFSEKMGATMIDVPMLAPDFRLDVEGILQAVNDKTRLVFVTTPNNPTGTYVPKNTIDRLINALPDHVVLVLDEVYHVFADAPDYTTALPYVKAGKQIIGVNSFSKSFGLAGMRIGYAYTTPELARYVQCLYKPFMHNLLSLEAAIAALSDQSFLERCTELVKSGRRYFYQAMGELGIHYWPSQGNFVLIRPNMPEAAFESRALEHGIMVRPASTFGAPGCIRVTIGTAEANEAFVKALQLIYAND